MNATQLKQIENVAAGEGLDMRRLLTDASAAAAANDVATHEASPATYKPRPPLPDSFAHLEGVTESGKLSAIAAAQEFLGAADAIEKAGLQYKIAGEEALRQGVELSKQFSEVAQEYRERAAQLFRSIETAAVRCASAVDLAHQMIDNLDRDV
jgi:hypothetical protein